MGSCVRDGEGPLFSGAGHRIGDLLPCCKPCNSKKGNRPWQAYITSREAPGPLRDSRIERLQRYLDHFFVADTLPTALAEYRRFIEIRDENLRSMREADEVAAVVREKMKYAQKR